MLKIGDKSISKLMLGDKAITKAYLGDKLVYQANKPIFLDYISFDGNSWIDTGYKPNSNTSVKVTYKPYYNTIFSCIFGSQDSTTSNRFYALTSSTVYKLQLNSCQSTAQFIGINPKALVFGANGTFASSQQKICLTIDSYNKQIKIESNELTNTYDTKNYSQYNNPNCSYNMYLGDRSTGGLPSSNKFKGEIYGFEIRESGVLVQDLRPCLDPKGVACFYDMVTKKYYYNKGTGTLGYDDSTKAFITVDADNAIITLTDFITVSITVDTDNAYIGVEQ